MSESRHEGSEQPSDRKRGWRSPDNIGTEPDASGTHEANRQLILRRLADEQRTTAKKRWWKTRP
jgi:hypothetical protein